MKEIQLKELQRAIKFIEAIGCKYKIIAPDGAEFGELELKPPKAKREHAYGEMTSFARSNLDLRAEIGSVQQIFVPAKYKPANIQATACHILTKAWGKDNYATSLDSNTASIEILRIA